MSRLQRSSVSFRSQGSSGRIWDDLKGMTPTAAAAVAPLHADDPFSPRAEPSSARSLRGRVPSAGVIAESPDVVASVGRSPASSVVVHGADGGARRERSARRRRRLSSAFCACMGHPPASHAQQ